MDWEKMKRVHEAMKHSNELGAGAKKRRGLSRDEKIEVGSTKAWTISQT